MAAPVVVASGAMAIAPAFMAAPHAAALAPTSRHTITAQLDAVVTPAAPTAPAASSYTVQAGDTLYGIALQYWGNGLYWPALYQDNRSTISNPNLIYVGQVVTVPASHSASSSTSSSTATPSSTAAPSTAAPSSADSATSSSATWPSSTASSTATSSTATSTAVPSSTSQGSTSTTSSSSGISAVETDIADGNNLLAIGQYLVDNGYSAAAAAGIASCVDGESGGNPESVGDGGGGLIGWTPLGSATPNANIVTGNVSADMLTQLADILYYNSNEIGQSQVDELNSQTDPVAAADFYSQNFERPAVTDSDVVPSVAEQVFSELGG